jgi:tape measure domain-containing protein
MAKNETVLKIRAEIENLQGLNRLKSAIRRASAEAKGADNDFRSLVEKVKELQAASVRSINNLNAQKDAFQALRKSVDLASKEYKDIGDEINKIDNELKEAQGTIVSYSKNSINALRAQKKELLAVRDAADVMSDEFKKAGVELAKLDKKLAKAEGRRAGGGGGRLGAAAQIAGTVAGAGVFGGPEGAIGAALGALAGPQGAIVGGAIGAQVGQLRQALGATAEYAASLRKLQIALFGVTTSQKEYEDALAFISKTTEEFAIPQDVLTRQFTKLQASVQGAGGNLEDTKKAFNGIVAAVRATGGSLSDVDAALTATAQVFSKGKVSAEELRQQIGERLPGAFTLFAESVNKTPQELDKALEKGEVTLQDFQTFAEAIFDRYGDTAKTIADAPESSGDRLKVALQELSKSVGTLLAPIGSAFQEVFIKIANVITRAAKALDNFFGVSSEATVRKNTLLIQAANKSIRDIRANLREAEASRGGVAAPFQQGIIDQYKRDIKELEAKRDFYRAEINRATGSQAFDIAQPQEGGGLAGGGGGGGGGGSRGRGIDEAARAAQRVEALRLKLSRGLENLGIKIKGIGTTAEEAIQTKYETALNNARFATEDFKRTIDEAAKTTKADYSELIKLVEQYETAVVTAADAERRAALGKLREKAFGEDLRRRYGLSPEILEGNVFGSIDTQAFPTGIDSILNPNKIKENINEIKASLAELVDPVNQVTSAANAIGTAFTDSFTSVINGSATTQEALANFFGNIGKYFLDMAAQIIQKMITMAILNQVVGLLPGLGSSASSFNLNGFGNLASDAGSGVSGFLAGASGILGKANGGPVNANQPYIVGERGPELFVPFQQGSITSNEALQQAATTQVPFTRNAESVTQAQETAQAMRAAGPIEVRYESNVINGVEYVTAEQHRKGMAQAAERGRSLTIQALQNSVKTRGRVGL